MKKKADIELDEVEIDAITSLVKRRFYNAQPTRNTQSAYNGMIKKEEVY